LLVFPPPSKKNFPSDYICESNKNSQNSVNFFENYCKLFNQVWVKFILLPKILSVESLKEILKFLPKNVLPYLGQNATLFTGFYTDIFDKNVDNTKTTLETSGEDEAVGGKGLAVLALSGLFYLITRHNAIESSDFLNSSSPLETSGEDRRGGGLYSRLYTLLDIDLFIQEPRGKTTLQTSGEDVKLHSKRVYHLGIVCRFLRLLLLALNSPLLPSKHVLSFVKKMLRIGTLLPETKTCYNLWCENTLGTSVVLAVFHSKRVCFQGFSMLP
jgi:hypothetical protein